jgi:hypothetical protein
MRQIIYFWALFLSILMLLTSPLMAQESDEPVGFVVAIRGEATALDALGAMRTLSMKSPVYEDDVLKTSGRGRIQILFSDNTIVSLGRKTEMKIMEYLWNPDEKTGKMKTSVKEGVFRVMGGAITKEAPQNFSTETPAATIGIRGSMYAGKVSNDQLVVVFEGGKGIDVTNDAGRVSITRPGFGTHIPSADLPPQRPKRFSQEEISDLNSELGADTEPGEDSEEETTASGGEEAESEQDDGTAVEEENQYSDENSENEEDGLTEDEEETRDEDTAPSEDEETPDDLSGDEPLADDNEDGSEPDENVPPEDLGDSADPQETDDTFVQELGDEGNPLSDAPVDSPEEVPPTEDEFIPNDDFMSDDEFFADDQFISDNNSMPGEDPFTDPFEDPDTFWPDDAAQDELEDTVTDTTQTGIEISGRFFAGTTAEDTTSDFSRWYGAAGGTSLNGSVAGSGTAQNGDIFDFSFAMNSYSPEASYTPPFNESGDPMPDFQSRFINLPGIDQAFQSAVISSNLGEFAIFLIKDGLFTNASTQYGYQDLGFAGMPTPSSSMPTDGLCSYIGPVLGLDIALPAGDTIHIENEMSGMWMEVNWLSRKVIGRMDFNHDPSDPMMETSPAGMTFFLADINGSSLTNMKLYGYAGPGDETSGRITWIEGYEEFAQFYGSQYQGIGMTGTGVYYDIESDQSTSIGSGRMICAGFREIEPDDIDLTSPTGSALFNGFAVGLAEDMNNIETDRRLFMNSDPNYFSLSIDRNTGTLSGTLSAYDLFSGACSINYLEIGDSYGSAYILDDNMVAMLGDTGSNAIDSNGSTGGLKPHGNYMITAKPDLQFCEFNTWGYWEISYEDPSSLAQYHLHVPGALWIAGELTPNSVIMDMAANNIQGHYTGGAEGICINTLSEVSALTGGTSQIDVDFATFQLTGNISFDQVNLPVVNGITSPSSATFSADISGATTSMVNGAFFGPNAEAVGGNFDAEMSGNRYMGIFGGERP